MKSFLKKIIPKQLFKIYYFIFAYVGALFYRFPAKRLLVIGITGTKGKTSTTNFLWSVLTASGIKTGIISTANIRIGEKEEINKFHMTMPGRFVIQKFLRQMVQENCECAIVEVTSQGLEQCRHVGIDFDIAIFTNLTPEHIDSHGSFENYKNAKGILFNYLTKSKEKLFRGKIVKKTIISNVDSEYGDFYLSFPAERKISFGIKNKASYNAENILQENSKTVFCVNNEKLTLSLPGVFNVYNALPAVVLGDLLSLGLNNIKKGLEDVSNIPGRMEEIKNKKGFKVFVDYAHEKASMTACVETARGLVSENGGRVIVLLGAEGGGRDKGKRPAMGEVVGKGADFVVVSNVDPYEDDPLPIAEDIANVAENFGKVRDENLFVILDRREGIRKALSLAKDNDVVMITGKGAEQTMIMGGKTISWDDRVVVKEELEKIK